MGTPPQSHGTSLAIWDHTVLYLPPDTSERAPPNPSHAGWYSIYLPLTEGWVDLVDLIAPRPGVEQATFRSAVRRRTAAPPRQLLCSQVSLGDVWCAWYDVIDDCTAPAAEAVGREDAMTKDAATRCYRPPGCTKL